MKPFERLWPRGGPAESRDVLDSTRTELVKVKEAFDEHDFAECVTLSGKQVREPVGRQVRAGGAAQVEVATVGCRVAKRPHPEGADPAVAVSPGAAESARPAGVGEDAGLGDFFLPVAGLLEQAACLSWSRDDAETRVGDRFIGEAAALEVPAGLGAAFADELEAAEAKEIAYHVCAPVG